MEDKKVFIARCGEVALKGLNKPYFEKTLVSRMCAATEHLPGVEIKRREGLIFIKTPPETDERQLITAITKVFGVASISPAIETKATLEAAAGVAISYVRKRMREQGVKTFKIEAKRADKSFPVKSPDIARLVGAEVLAGCEGLTVDVRRPDCLLFVEIRKDHAYLYEEKIAGFGGLPLGTNGKGLVLLSGGIDSPVAAWMMAKRGMRLEAVHFHSYPYTDRRAQEKVEQLAGILAAYCGPFALHAINLLPIQEAIAAHCREDEMTIHIRRFMMRIAEKVARETRCDMLITGENLGQVASQTAEALVVTDEVVALPVMRPLIALDKVDIIAKAKEIGTYETSIQPYEDCCSVFLPKHPVTKPKLEKIKMSESGLDVAALVEAALADTETVRCNSHLVG